MREWQSLPTRSSLGGEERVTHRQVLTPALSSPIHHLCPLPQLLLRAPQFSLHLSHPLIHMLEKPAEEREREREREITRGDQ